MKCKECKGEMTAIEQGHTWITKYKCYKCKIELWDN
jgi:hypothetical protein